jgi:branched-chain amino acid transport system permease protein
VTPAWWSLLVGPVGGWSLAVVLIAIAACFPFLVGIEGLSEIQLVLIYVMVAIGLNISFGFAGEFAVAQVVVMGVSAYTAGILSVTYGWSAWKTLPAALVAGVLTGVVLSAPGFRLKGWYLTITTFFAAVVFPDLVTLLSRWTNGTNGLVGIGPLPGVGFVLGTSTKEYEIIYGITLVLFLGMYNLSRSSWGITLRAMRDAPHAAIACGVKVPVAKAVVAVVSSIPVAIAGWVFAHSSGAIGPMSFSISLTIIIIAGVVLGGVGTVWGPVVGTTIIGVVTYWIGPFSSYNEILVGMVVLVSAIAVPHGLVPVGKQLLFRFAPSRRSPGDGVPADGTLAVGSIASEAEGDASATHSSGSLTEHPPEVSPSFSHEVICEVTDVCKSFGGVSVLEGVSLTVARGEVVGLVGPNGSGKTTLLNVITGHVRPDSGSTRLFGSFQAERRSPRAVAAAGVRRSFQVPRLIGELSVADNIRLGLIGSRHQLTIAGILRLPIERRYRRRDELAVRRVAASLGIPMVLLAQRADALPLGLRRIVEVARAIVGGPALVCLDEPGAGVAGEEIRRLGEIIRLAARNGSGVLVIEHNLGFVDTVSDRIVRMSDGRLELVGQDV